jgi:acyl-CoA synthetase (AMP-forming)/AMP-acid ligase II
VNLIDNFLQRAEKRPDHVAIREGSGRRISFAALKRQSASLASAFAAKGVSRGDRVLVGVWPGIDLYAGLAAIWRLGAVAVFPEPATGVAGFRHAAAATKPKALLAGWKIRTLALLFEETRRIPIGLSPSANRGRISDDCASLAEGDPALISFTSGSSGAPKGMARSHGLMLAQHAALASLIGTNREDEIDLVAFPAFVLTCLGHGVTSVMPSWDVRRHDRADPNEVLAQIEAVGATRLLLPPVITQELAGTRLPPTVHRVLTGGGPVYPDVARRFLAGSPEVGLTVVYGSTEAEPIAHARADEFDEEIWREASMGAGLPVGAPVPEARVRLVDDEIVVAGPHVNPGYLDPARDRETKIFDGATIWHRTGDAGRFDAAGRLWLLGRCSSAARGLFPFSVETAVRLWPGVRAAVMVARESGRSLLFIEGDETQLAQWRRLIGGIGDLEVVAVRAMPMDRRHRSKPDVRALMQAQAGRAG